MSIFRIVTSILVTLCFFLQSSHAKSVSFAVDSVPANCNSKCFTKVMKKHVKNNNSTIKPQQIAAIFNYADGDNNQKLNKKEVQKINNNWLQIQVFINGQHSSLGATGYPGAGPQPGSICVQEGRTRQTELYICTPNDCAPPTQECCLFEATIICTQDLLGGNKWMMDGTSTMKKSCRCCEIEGGNVGNCSGSSSNDTNAPGGEKTDQTEAGN